MRNLIEEVLIRFRRNRIENICKDIDWAKEQLLSARNEEEENFARHYIDICNYELLDIDIN